jgi:2-methylcitrate synthase
MAEAQQSAGLAGVTAGETTISAVGKAGKGLEYRGYDIYDLAEHGTFEEVSYLLLYDKLPNTRELGAYRRRLKDGRSLPKQIRDTLESIPAETHPMDVLRTGCSLLGCLEPEKDFKQQHQVAERLLSAFPSILLYWFRFHADGQRIRTKTDDDSIAGHFLKLLYGVKADDIEQRCMDVSLMLYAEHEFNASTFTARVCAATLSDFYSCITGAIGTLRGPLHGGANERAMDLIERFKTPAAAEKGIHSALEKKEKIMGFGHRVYKESDPRSQIIKGWAERL